MKKRKISTLVLMSVLTVGFYSWYWIYETRREMVAKGYSITSFFAYTLAIFFIGVFILFLGIGAAAEDSISNSSLGQIKSVIIGAAIVGTLIEIWFFISYSRAVEKTTNGKLKLNTIVAIAILSNLVVLGLNKLQVGIFATGLGAATFPAIVQYYFNQLPENPQPQQSSINQSTSVVPPIQPNPPNPQTPNSSSSSSV
jgi:hypothetical protein